MEPAKPMIRRCAIYTRKSSEEGLEQDFNSLQAQREACEAFIKSQASEGWRLVRTHYDDGGLSGASMERPALKQLLEHIGQGLIEAVVVYKVDRLTRSLADFARIIERFDAHHVSFVAVTQQFNTTTSMGRLTLNVLLSFAQFEREVTGERIRDKIAASKRKGIWMGGVVPLGYELRERRLVINPAEVELVRRIFQRYLALGSVRLLKEELDRRSVVSRIRAFNGKPARRYPFSRGALYVLLSNPLYIGEVRHRGVRHPGQHQPIVERESWEKVQRHLYDHTVPRPQREAKVEPSPLVGKLFDESGQCLTPSHARKGGRRYRYYLSRSLTQGPANGVREGWRLPAPELERTVAAAAQQLLSDEPAIATAVDEVGVAPSQLPAVFATTREYRQKLQSEAAAAAAMATLIERVELRRDGLRLSLKLALPTGVGGDDQRSGAEAVITRFMSMRIKRCGVELRLLIDSEPSLAPKVDLVLLKAVARARRWFEDLAAGRAASIAALAAQQGKSVRYVGRLIRLAFLAPAIVEAIVAGRQPAELSVELLSRRTHLQNDWHEQQRMLGITPLDC